MLDVGKGLCPSIEGVIDGKRDPGSEVADSTVTELSVVDIGRSNPPSSIDNSMVAFVGCEVEIDDIVDG